MARVLVVDDNQLNLEMLETLLIGHGHDVDKARNGVEALEHAQRSPPDILVTDILMPEMDGFTLCRHWKADEILKQRPLVFYTATYTDMKDEEFALNLGADRFVRKPTKPADLVREIENMLDDQQTGELDSPHEPEADETALLKQYNEVLVRKLEDHVQQLRDANRELQQRIEELHSAQVGLRVRDRALAATPTGILITDPNQEDNPIVDCNRAFEKITGYSREEVIGRNCRFLQGIESDEPNNEANNEALQELRSAIRERRSTQVVIQNRTKEGRIFWNRLIISPVHDEQGKVSHFVGVQEDITEQRRAEKDARRAAIASAQLEMLSPREQEVLQHVVSGRPNKSIAQQMDISVKTVEKHRSSLMKKLKVRSLADLVRLATLADSQR